MEDKKITLKYVLAITGAVIFTWLIHEFSHWLASISLGYDSIMRLNSVSYLAGENPTEWHRIIVSAAGPIVTILQAIVAFLFLKSQKWNKYIYPLLFTAFYMRFVAAQMNLINPNDEGRISAFLGIGTYTLPMIVSVFLFLLVYAISRKYKLDWKFQLVTVLLVMISSSVLILSDQFFGIRIL